MQDRNDFGGPLGDILGPSFCLLGYYKYCARIPSLLRLLHTCIMKISQTAGVTGLKDYTLKRSKAVCLEVDRSLRRSEAFIFRITEHFEKWVKNIYFPDKSHIFSISNVNPQGNYCKNITRTSEKSHKKEIQRSISTSKLYWSTALEWI